MRSLRMICLFTSLVGILMISVGLFIQNNTETTMKKETVKSSFDIKNMAASSNMIVKEVEEEKTDYY